MAMAVCPHCGVQVRSDRLDRHVSHLHLHRKGAGGPVAMVSTAPSQGWKSSCPRCGRRLTTPECPCTPAETHPPPQPTPQLAIDPDTPPPVVRRNLGRALLATSAVGGLLLGLLVAHFGGTVHLPYFEELAGAFVFKALLSSSLHELGR